ncbi:MAG: ribosome-associated translation inhibitor RaiA [Deltaproteobacteria bacterium]|nr:ribosome-associated translation inhibitor RaiA [Deltaproteobacteria bacterium]
MALEMTIAFKNCEPAEGLRDYVEKKILHATEDLHSLREAQVTFKVEGFRQKVDVTIYGNNIQFFAEGESNDMYASVDLMHHKLDSQLHKYKEKMKDHKKFEQTHEGELRYAKNLFDEKRLQILRKKEGHKK